MPNHRQAAAAAASIAAPIVDGMPRSAISDGVKAVPAAAIRPERVEWLWPDRIPPARIAAPVHSRTTNPAWKTAPPAHINHREMSHQGGDLAIQLI